MKTQAFTTCKLIFEHGTTRQNVVDLLAKHTNCGSIANFEPDITVGCNRLAFAVVDVPEGTAYKLLNDSGVKEVDMMASYSRLPTTAECCASGGCGCGP